MGRLELRVPQDREGRFSTGVFERYQRSEQALVLTLMEMYVQGVSTRKVAAVAEALCGHEFSAGTVSEMKRRLDEKLQAFAGRRLEGRYRYMILDARYERVREEGLVRKRAVMFAIGVNGEGRREVLGLERADRETESGWREFLKRLKERGLHGGEYGVSDDHAGLRRAIEEMLPEAVWQRCYVHFLRNALDYLPARAPKECLREWRQIYDRPSLEEARWALGKWLERWGRLYRKLGEWVEENIEETLVFYRLPAEHRQAMRAPNMLERLNEEIRRRTQVVRIFPNEASCRRLILALVVELHERWMDGPRYLDMRLLEEPKEQRKQQRLGGIEQVA